MKQSELPDVLQKKISAVAKAKRPVVRRITEQEAGLIRGLSDWQNGWFAAENNAQVVIHERKTGPSVILAL